MINSSWKEEFKVFIQLLHRDFLLFKQNIIDNIINNLCWIILSAIVYQFIMPEMGCIYRADFLLVSCVISRAFFGVMDGVCKVVGDLDGDKTITYDMTLPISHTLLFTKIAISHGLQACLLSLVVFPAGKIILWNQLNYPYFHTPKFLLIIIFSSLFSGFFSLLIIGITKSLMQIEDVWRGILFPLYALGGFQFTWKVMYTISPFLSYLNCLNPVMYMFEGIRGATLDPSLSIPFWICCCMLIVFTIPTSLIGIYLLKRRLDAI